MSPTLALWGSIATLLLSVVTAVTTAVKVASDRRKGISDQHLDQTRFSLESMQAALAVKDVLIQQYREEIDRLNRKIDEMDEDLDNRP